MWLNSEIDDLKSIVSSDSKLENFLTKQEIDVIKQNSTRYVNLKNQVFVPQHNRKVMLVTQILDNFYFFFLGQNNHRSKFMG